MNLFEFEEAQEKRAQSRTPARKGSPDDFQTPPGVLEPLCSYLEAGTRVWESACGQGNLVRGFQERGYHAWGTDILNGEDFFFWNNIYLPWDIQVTNPPYSRKDEWLARSYNLGKPFALLMPISALGEKKRHGMYADFGIQLILFPGRVNFRTPSGQGSGAWFDVAWFTWKLGLDRDLTFWRPPDEQPVLEYR